jgi:DNA-binding response OmpR family regulator
MASVCLLTRREDLVQLRAALERAGLTVSVASPQRILAGELPGETDAVVADLRDVSSAALTELREGWAEGGGVVVVVTAAGQLERVPADLKVDDFAVLPVTGEELARRVERALWRRHGIGSENAVECGALHIDLANYRVTVDGEPVVMTFKEYELLRFLAMNTGRVFTREQLLNRVWGYDYFGGARTVDVHIRRIRSKIEVRGLSFIETVRNVGYRMRSGE